MRKAVVNFQNLYNTRCVYYFKIPKGFFNSAFLNSLNFSVCYTVLHKTRHGFFFYCTFQLNFKSVKDLTFGVQQLHYDIYFKKPNIAGAKPMHNFTILIFCNLYKTLCAIYVKTCT